MHGCYGSEVFRVISLKAVLRVAGQKSVSTMDTDDVLIFLSYYCLLIPVCQLPLSVKLAFFVRFQHGTS